MTVSIDPKSLEAPGDAGDAKVGLGSCSWRVGSETHWAQGIMPNARKKKTKQHLQVLLRCKISKKNIKKKQHNEEIECFFSTCKLFLNWHGPVLTRHSVGKKSIIRDADECGVHHDHHELGLTFHIHKSAIKKIPFLSGKTYLPSLKLT